MNKSVATVALFGVLALGAARTQVATIPSGTTPRYAAAASNGALVILASGSNNTLNVIDGRSFTKVPSSLVLTSSGNGVKSITVGTDTTPELVAGTKNGKAEQWNVVDLLDFADGFGSPTPRVFALPSPIPTGTAGPVTGVAIGSAGARLYAADSANKTVTAFDDSTGTAVSGGIALGHTPLTALDVDTGFLDRIFFGTD